MASRALLAGVVLLGYLAATHRRRDGGLPASASPGASRSCSACSTQRSRSGSSPGASSTSTRAPPAIAQATVPIFSLLIGLRFLPHERIGAATDRRRRRSGSSASRSSPAARPTASAWAVAGTLAVVLASVFYASAGIYGQLRLSGTVSGPVLATGSMLVGGVHPAAARARAAADVDAHGGRDRLAAAARARSAPRSPS